MSSGREDLHRLTKEMVQKFDIVVACGGDGTVNEVFHAAYKSEVILGVLPIGSGNDFAKAMGFSTNPEVAIEQLRSSSPQKVDLVEYNANANKGIMANTMGVGFDGLVNFEASRIRRVKGSLIYILAALRASLKRKPSKFTIISDGALHEEHLLMLTLANGSVEGGNFKVAPHANPTDGYLEVLSVKPMNLINLLVLLPLFLIGKQQISRKVSYTRAKKLSFVMETPQHVHVDGEFIGDNIFTISVEVLTGAVSVLRPN
jgi:diacylglycerol kinase (ATP)